LEKVEDYRFSLKNTAIWSQLTNVKYNILVNVGLSEHNKFEEIESAHINPSKEESNSRLKSMKLKSYIIHILREYNILINHDKIVELPYHIKNLLKEQKETYMKELEKSMPKFTDFLQLDEKYKYSLSVINYSNFLQEYLANIFIRIDSESSDKYKILASNVIKYYINYIIENEKTLSIPKPIIYNIDITSLENATDESQLSGSDFHSTASEKTDSEEENAVEVYENDIDNEGFDVENANDIWENE
jgi:hypothetical protein